MSRSMERKLLYVVSGWQLLTGFITIFFYASYWKMQGADAGLEQNGFQSWFDNLYIFSVTYGLFFVVIAVLNIIFARKLLGDNTLQYKLPVYWIGLAAVCYFLSDYISLMLLLIVAVVALAKNKPIRLQTDK